MENSGLFTQLYGNFRTRTFTELYGDVSTFLNDYTNNGIPQTISTKNASTLYYLLYAYYGNSHISSSDENTFKYRLWSIIFMYGNAWEKKLEIQSIVKNLTAEELFNGGTNINNHSYNPSTAPSTSTIEELTTIDSQDTNKSRKSILSAYGDQYYFMEDVTKEFLNKFKGLFIVITNPELPLWYQTETEE